MPSGSRGVVLTTAGLTVGAAVGDLEDAAGLAAQLPRDGVEIGPLNHREEVHRARGVGVGGAGGAGAGMVGETPCGASAMVCHSDVYQGSPGRAVAASAPGVPGTAAVRGQLHLIGNVAGHHEPEPLAGLRRDVHRVGELDLLLLEFGDLCPQLGLGGRQLFHLGPLREVGAHRPGDGQGEHTHHGGQDRRPPGRRAEPLLGLLLGRRNNGFPDRIGAVVRFGRWRRPRFGAPRFTARRSRSPRTAPARSTGLRRP